MKRAAIRMQWCASVSFWCLHIAVAPPTSISLQLACPLPVQTGFLTSTLAGICAGQPFVTEPCQDSPQVFRGTPALPSGPAAAHVVTNVTMSLTAKIAGVRPTAWLLHRLLKCGPSFLAHLGTSSCCLLLLSPSIFSSHFQCPSPHFHSLIFFP